MGDELKAEPAWLEMGDYINEFAYPIIFALRVEARKVGADPNNIRVLNDDVFRRALTGAQARPIRTIAERYAPGSIHLGSRDDAESYERLIAGNPLRIASADQFVAILNTTQSPLAYKQAYNSLLRLIRPDVGNDFFPVDDAVSADSLRKTLPITGNINQGGGQTISSKPKV